MSIWEYRQSSEQSSFEEILRRACQFCGSKLVESEIEDHWVGISQHVSGFHEANIRGAAEVHGEFILDEMEIVGEADEYTPKLRICPRCGWWIVSKEFIFGTPGQVWYVACAAAAALKRFDVVDIRTPVSEVRQYLTAKFSDRYAIDPRCFEDVVASVFASFGFRAEVTAFSADGGVDVVLRDQSGRTIAVQVKRYKAAIEVSQIREFIGAMMLGGYTWGIFVTTSRFQAGAYVAAAAAETRGWGVELVDGEGFLKKLCTAQVTEFGHYKDAIANSFAKGINLHFCEEHHLNSL